MNHYIPEKTKKTLVGNLVFSGYNLWKCSKASSFLGINTSGFRRSHPFLLGRAMRASISRHRLFPINYSVLSATIMSVECWLQELLESIPYQKQVKGKLITTLVNPSEVGYREDNKLQKQIGQIMHTLTSNYRPNKVSNTFRPEHWMVFYAHIVIQQAHHDDASSFHHVCVFFWNNCHVQPAIGWLLLALSKLKS